MFGNAGNGNKRYVFFAWVRIKFHHQRMDRIRTLKQSNLPCQCHKTENSALLRIQTNTFEEEKFGKTEGFLQFI